MGSSFLRLMRRAASIGVSENDTISETSTANDAVSPKLDINRPTMPCIKPIGTNTAISDSVVAKTANPISRVPSIAAWCGLMPFSSTKRKMFSSTTMASSMTIPTISVRLSIVIELSV